MAPRQRITLFAKRILASLLGSSGLLRLGAFQSLDLLLPVQNAIGRSPAPFSQLLLFLAAGAHDDDAETTGRSGGLSARQCQAHDPSCTVDLPPHASSVHVVLGGQSHHGWWRAGVSAPDFVAGIFEACSSVGKCTRGQAEDLLGLGSEGKGFVRSGYGAVRGDGARK